MTRLSSIREIRSSRDIIATYATNMGVLTISFATGILSARLLGASGKGILVLAFYVPGLLSTWSSFSIGQSLIYTVRHRELEVHHLLYAVIAPTLVISFVVIGGYWLAFPWLKATILKNLDEDLARLTILAFPALLLKNYVGKNVFRALGRILWTNIASVIHRVVPFLFLVGGLVLVARTARVAVYASLAAQGLLGLGLMGLLFLISYPPAFSLSLKQFEKIVLLGWRYHIVTILSSMEYRVDVLVMSSFLDPAQIGLYSVGVTIAQLPWMFSNSVGMVLFPKIASLPEEDATRYTCTVTRHTLLFNAIVALGLIVAARPLIGITYGADFLPSYLAFVLLAPGIVVNSVFRTLAGYFAGIGEPLMTARVSVVTLLSNIGLNLYLDPRFGFLGAAVASTTTYTIGGVTLLYLFLRRTKSPWREVLFLQTADRVRFKRHLSSLRPPSRQPG